MQTTRQPTSERRAQLVNAALEIISQEGVSKLTAAYLGKKVGITDGTVFRHFKNMGELVDAAIGQFESLLFADFPPEDTDPLRRLRRFFFKRVSLLREHPHIMRLAFSDRLAEAAGERGAERMKNMVDRSFEFVRACLFEAVDKDMLARDISINVFLMSLTGTMRGLALSGDSTSAAGISVEPEQAWNDLETLWRRSVDKPLLKGKG